MLMSLKTASVYSSLILCLYGCSHDEQPIDKSKLGIESNPAILKQLQTKPIQPFAQTAEDQHDLDLLNAYVVERDRINASLEQQLVQDTAAGKSSAQLTNQRKYATLEALSNNLKALALKSAQGRYIQTIWLNYWDTQRKQLKQQQQR